MPAHLQLPIHQDNLLEVYKLIKVNGIVTQGHVIFNIELPLTNPREFQLMHINPIIATINGTLTAVEVSTKFLAISLHHDEFFPMSQHEVEGCWNLGNAELICPNIAETYQATRHPMVHKCELDMLHDQLDPRCEFSQLRDTTVWKHLYNSNQYLYSTIDSIKLNAVCGSDILHITLDGRGLVNLHPECVIKNDLITIQGRQQIITSLQATNTHFDSTIGWTKQYASMNFSAIQFKPSVQQLEEMQQELAEMLKTTIPANEVSITTHGIIIGYIAIAILLAITVIIVYRYTRSKIKFCPNPAPTLRQQTTAC